MRLTATRARITGCSPHGSGLPAVVSDAAFLAALPSGGIGVWVVDKYSATPVPYVPNMISAGDPSQNLIRGVAGKNAVMFTVSGVATITDGQVGPDGTTADAMRVTASSGSNWYIYYKYHINGSALGGTLTIAVDVKSANGSGQNFRMSADGGVSSATKSATTSWQTVTYTKTGAGTDCLIIPIWSPDGTTGGDLYVRIRLFAGASDLGADTLLGHMILGTTPVNLLPAYSSGYLDFSAASSVASANFQHTTITAATAVCIARKATSGTGVGYQAFLSRMGDSELGASPFDTLTAYLETTRYGTLSAMGALNSQYDDTLGGGIFDPYALGGWHMWSHSADSTGQSFGFDDLCKFARTSTIIPSTDFNSILFGKMNYLDSVFDCHYQIAAIALFNRRLNTAELRSVRGTLAARLSAKSGISLSPKAPRVYVAEGDSITASADAYPRPFAKSHASPAVQACIYAVSGSVITGLVARSADLDSLISAGDIAGGRKFILSVLLGRNDLNSSPPLTFLSDLSAYLDARRSAGWIVVVCTILPSTNPGFNANRNTVNAGIRTWVGTHCDAIADFASDPTMGIDGDGSTTGPWNTTYYYDGTHPTTAGQLLLEPYLRAAVNAI